MKVSKALLYFIWSVWFLFCIFGVIVQWSDFAYGKEIEKIGPTTGKIIEEMDGLKAEYPATDYKVVGRDYECTKKNPCPSPTPSPTKTPPKAEVKKDVEKLHKELTCKPCPKCPEPKTVYKYIDHIKEIPVEKKVAVEKPYMKKNVFRLMLGIGEDGISTTASKDDPYAEDAKTYYSGIAGGGYTRFFDESIGIGIFGLFGGNTSKMIGISGELAW